MTNAPLTDIEFYRTAYVLISDKNAETILVDDTAKERLFCSCQRGKRPTCEHAEKIRKSWEALKAQCGEKTPWEALLASPFHALLMPVMKLFPIPMQSFQVIQPDGTTQDYHVVGKDGSCIARLWHNPTVAERLRERITSERDNPSARGSTIRRCQGFTLSPTERQLADSGHQTQRMKQEGSIWCRLAYHLFIETLGSEIKTEVDIDSVTGDFWIVWRVDDISTPICRVLLPRNAVGETIDQLLTIPTSHQFTAPTEEAELYHRFQTDPGLGQVTITLSVRDHGREYVDLNPRLVYGNRVYLPGSSHFLRLSFESMQILSRNWDATRTVSFVECAELLENNADVFSRAHSEATNSLALDLFSTGGDGLERIIGLPVVRSFGFVELTPEKIDGQTCTLRIAYSSGEVKIDLADIVSARIRRRRFAVTATAIVDCSADGVARLPLSGIDLQGDATVTIQRSALLQFRDEPNRIKIGGESAFSQQLISLMQVQPSVPLGPLRGYKSRLRDYQRIGLEWLMFLYDNQFGGLLADEMGLGKTHQLIAMMCAVKFQRRETRPFLVVCPVTVISHWQKLLEQFAPKMRVLIFHGADRETLDSEASDVVLTSYGVCRKDVEILGKARFAAVIFDEAQNIKNRATAAWQAADHLTSEVKIGVTGTPIENSLSDLKALFDLTLPGYLGSDDEFMARFVNPIENENDNKTTARLKRLTSPFILRRTQSSVLTELPEKIIDHRTCTLSEFQRNLYAECLKRESSPLLSMLYDRSQPVSYIHIFAVLGKLKMICNHPALALGKPNEWEQYESGKFDLFREIAEESLAEGHKIVVFSHYLSMIDILKSHFTSRNIGCVALTGRSRDRGEIIREFGKNPQCKVFIGSLKAGGSGIDLVAGSVVIHYDRWWNAAREDQATSRAHRIGQKKVVQVFTLTTQGTLEERIDSIIARKRSLSEESLHEDESGALKALTREELIELLQDVRG